MHSNVEHPKHYQMPERKECMEEIIDVLGVKGAMYFCLGNVYKYKYRHTMKNGEEDLEKAKWYSKKYLELGGSESMLARLEDCFK